MSDHPDKDAMFWEIAEEEIREGQEVTVRLGPHVITCSSIEQLHAARAQLESESAKPSHLPVTSAWFRGYEAGKKRAKKSEDAIRRIASTASKQRSGGFTTESDAMVALMLIQSLSMALLGEELPVAGSEQDS